MPAKGAPMKMHALAATACFTVFSLCMGAAEPLSTDRLVHGVITAVDPARTKITLHGKPAKLSDLMVTSHAKAELCLDETWISIDEH